MAGQRFECGRAGVTMKVVGEKGNLEMLEALVRRERRWDAALGDIYIWLLVIK